MALLDHPAGEVVVHVEAASEACQVSTPRGEPVACSVETAQRVACDASVVTIVHDKDGNVLDVGRKTRRIPTALKRALAARDGGCKYPGCPNQHVDAHHIDHWADGGETKLSNLIQLCRFHHRMLHEGGYTIRDGAFVNSDGITIPTHCTLPAPSHTSAPAGASRWAGVDFTWRDFDYSYASTAVVAK